jgi:hypothetical protein
MLPSLDIIFFFTIFDDGHKCGPEKRDSTEYFFGFVDFFIDFTTKTETDHIVKIAESGLTDMIPKKDFSDLYIRTVIKNNRISED